MAVRPYLEEVIRESDQGEREREREIGRERQRERVMRGSADRVRSSITVCPSCKGYTKQEENGNKTELNNSILKHNILIKR
jgi:hypothetical protein